MSSGQKYFADRDAAEALVGRAAAIRARLTRLVELPDNELADHAERISHQLDAISDGQFTLAACAAFMSLRGLVTL